MKHLVQVFTPTGAMRAWATVLMVILCFGLALGLTIGYVAKNRRDDDRRWCSLVSNLDEAYQAQPPKTELGQKIARDMHELRAELRC